MFEGMKKAATTKTGPNDMFRRVVWAISMFFFFVLYIY